MKKLNLLTEASQPRDRRGILSLAALTVAVSGALMSGCSSDSSSSGGGTTSGLPVIVEPTNPLSEVLKGTGLNCDATLLETTAVASTLAVVAPDSIPNSIISRDEFDESELKANAGNNIKRLSAVVAGQTPEGLVAYEEDGITPIGDVHPVIVSYAEQVIGDYVLGDGSADLGDPTHIDDMFASISMDNGKSWKKQQIADTSTKSSIEVSWGNSSQVEYRGHSHKPTMAVSGNNVLVAWNDKYCPSGNPFGFEKVDDSYPDDYFKVNGKQGSIDYAGLPTPDETRNLYEVPFSCVWTARGVFVEDTGEGLPGIDWRQAQQLTSGTRDTNKIWISSASVGFALTWQEDPEGLRAGKGAGPGEGFSGATTNHGTDIWYSYIGMDDFGDVCEDADGPNDVKGDDDDCLVIYDGVTDQAAIALLAEKPKPAVNFEPAVRITNNEICDADPEKETKPYCHAIDAVSGIAENCIATTEPLEVGNNSGTTVSRCVQSDLDYMTPDSTFPPAAAILDGDTGASRPALKLLKTNAVFEDDPATELVDESKTEEFVAILAYEETKGLSESDQGDGIPNNGEGDDTIIALEGKGVYFESFLWNQPVTVSAGRIVNLRVPGVDITQDPDTKEVIVGAETNLDIYENARRVVIAPQVDSCDATAGVDPTFAIMYKMGYDTQGGSSDMFIRKNFGFTYETFENSGIDEDGFEVDPVDYNISSRKSILEEVDGKVKPTGAIEWDETNLDDQSYTYPEDNTFSPRAFLRGNEIYAGFEFSEIWRQTAVGTLPNNFWINRYVDDGAGLEWQGPQKISIVTGAKTSTLDPRFITTPKGLDTTMPSDQSNPNLLFMSYGTFDMSTGTELDLYYTRSIDKGMTWEYLVSDGDGGFRAATVADYGTDGIAGTADDLLQIRLAKLAAKDAVEEKEVQSLASPDGSLLFNAWLQETHAQPDGIDPSLGLESRGAKVEYAEPVVD